MKKYARGPGELEALYHIVQPLYTHPLIKILMNKHPQMSRSLKKGIVVSLAVGLMAAMVQAQPTITQQPTNQAVAPGATATFSVAVSGTGPFTYQWQCDGTNIPAAVIRTVAGNGTNGFSGDGGAATNAELQVPYGILVDNRGRLFIAASQNFRVRMVDTNGKITTVAGNGVNGNPSDGSVATNAPLGSIVGLAMDTAGNLFLSDQGFKAIRKVDTNGIITTVVSSAFGLNGGLCVDANDNIFVADAGRSFPPIPGRIVEVQTNGTVTTVAGGGSSYPGDGGPALVAALRSPDDVAVDSAGQLFIAEQGVVCKVDTNGIIETIASAGQAVGVKVDGAGNLFFADKNNDRVYEVMAVDGKTFVTAGNGTTGFSGDGGPATTAELNNPLGVALDSAGDVFISDNSNSRVREVTGIPAYPASQPTFLVANVSLGNTGNYSVVVTGSGGSVTSSVVMLTIFDPPVITTPPASQLVFAGQSVSLNIVAQGAQPMSYQWIFDGTNLDGQTNATLSFASVSTNNAGTYVVIVGDSYGSVTSAPPAELMVAGPIANNRVWSTGSTITLDLGNSLGNIGQYEWQRNGTDVPADIINTIAGDGAASYAGDGGTAVNAKLYSPTGVAVDSAGNVFIADYFNSLIRKVDTNGKITTVAGLVTNGNISWGYSGDGHAATNAQLNNPESVVVDAAGNLFIADSGNNRIRKVDTNGIITTVAGNGVIGYSGDNDAATNAQLALPTSVAVDTAGNLFIADFYNSLVRKVDVNGIITTFAGKGTNDYSGDGGAATDAALNSAVGVAVDANANVLIADSGNNRIRKVVVQGPALTLQNATTNDTGGYRVIVSGSFGSLTSSVVNVGVITSPLIYQDVLNSDKSFTLGLMNLSGSQGVVLWATNLSSPVWQPIYTNSNGGIWQFTDTNTGGAALKFYRLRAP